MVAGLQGCSVEVTGLQRAWALRGAVHREGEAPVRLRLRWPAHVAALPAALPASAAAAAAAAASASSVASTSASATAAAAAASSTSSASSSPELRCRPLVLGRYKQPLDAGLRLAAAAAHLG